MMPVPKEKRENGYKREKKTYQRVKRNRVQERECSSQQKVDTYF